MREKELRTVLLVKAIEDADRVGTLIPAAERIAAARQAKRDHPGTPEATLSARAQLLFDKLQARRPFVSGLRDFAGGPAWLSLALLAVAFLIGLGLSVLDGSHRINILAFPLLALVAWNLLVYVWIVLSSMRGGGNPRKPRYFSSWLTHLGLGRVNALVAKSRAFDSQLAEALANFTRDWSEAARPLLLARATRVFHLCAAMVGVGLIAGMYARGMVFDYRAGWESTFLDAAQARQWLGVTYGAASFVTGIPIPDAPYLEMIRWRNGSAGESAARWIHLLAATTMLFVVIPRLLLALQSTAQIARWSRNTPLPGGLAPYMRLAFNEAGGLVDRGIVMVIPFAYEPTNEALVKLRMLLASEVGDHLNVDIRPVVAYGNEETIVRNLQQGGGELADAAVLLMNLASTPEDENHGAVIDGVRDWLAANRPHTKLIVMVDEGPYAARMGPGDRVDERRRAWSDFIRARGLDARLADLAK